MKPGSRALGVAESFRPDHDLSTLCGVVARADRTVDGVAFSTATVGGTDATAAVVDVYERLDREDVQYVLVAGIALSWYNPVDLHAVADGVDRPALSVTFEESEGLVDPLREAFDGDALADRLATYRAQPERHRVDLGDADAFVRAVGLAPERAAAVVRGFTPEGGRPEPLRVARMGARAGSRLRTADAAPGGAT